ncbi:UDP-glucuronosyltransferase 2A2-like [Ptychodera flava]|uniref:UDP-glucuronosyltransferase 2A2-like n=1 Tax=Ptychodera flava TaxID=63121 RepID=UPI003969DBC7
MKHKDLLTSEDVEASIKEYSRLGVTGQGHKIFDIVVRGITSSCEGIFQDGDLLRAMRSLKADLILGDGYLMCPALVAEHLQVPFILISFTPLISYQAVTYRIPNPLSYIPEMSSGYTDKMTFFQRTWNVILHFLLSTYLDRKIVEPFNAIKEKYNLSTETSMQGKLGKAELRFFSTDFSLEFPRPLTPNIVLVGGLLTEPSKPLPQELSDFYDSAGEAGVVVVSMGTILSLRSDTTDVFASALARLPQKVVWKLEKAPSNLGNNTMVMPWLPQNDLLGHPKTKALVYHGGLNGVFEAIYHGVPVVGIPMQGDQFENILRITVKGMAIKLDITTITADTLYEAIQTICNKKSYKHNAKRLSDIHRDQPLHPLDRAVFWIEYVLTHGGASHLRPAGLDQPSYQYYLLDVLCFFVFVIFLLMFFLRIICRFLCISCQTFKINKSRLKFEKEI